MGRAVVLYEAGPSIFGVKLGHPMCASCPVPYPSARLLLG